MATVLQKVTVYTVGHACIQCRLTAHVMAALGLSCKVVDLTDDANAAAREYVADLGYTQAPVVVVDDHDHWSGFQPARIKQLAARLQATSGRSIPAIKSDIAARTPRNPRDQLAPASSLLDGIRAGAASIGQVLE